MFSWYLCPYFFLVVCLCSHSLSAAVDKNDNNSASAEDTLGLSSSVLKHFTLTSTFLPTLQVKHTSGCVNITLVVKSKSFTFCVLTELLTNSDVAMHDVKIYVLNTVESESQPYSLQDMNITIARGSDVNQASVNYLDGYIENNSFYGKMYIEKDTYFVEPVHKFPDILKQVEALADVSALSKAVVYEPQDIMFDSFADEVQSSLDTFDSDSERQKKPEQLDQSVKQSFLHRRSAPDNTAGRVCDLLLLADHLYLRDVASDNVSLAVVGMLRAADLANVIFRNADFDNDGSPDNVGLRVKYVMVLTEASEQNFLRDFEGGATEPLAGLRYLERMAQYAVLRRVCMGVAFTARRFKAHAIGLSYTASQAQQAKDNGNPMLGGICERPIMTKQNYNVLALTALNEAGKRVPELMVALSLAHELGHSFGSEHDNDSVSLMLPYSLTGRDVQHYKFSEKSRQMIRRVLHKKGFCLQRDHRAFCGNGLVEAGEDCDCGLPVDCLAKDPCCIPRGRPHACHVDASRGYACHPSQGPCCLPSCQLRDLEQEGLNCSAVLLSCPCRGVDCTCGYHGTCVGDTCHSRECVRLSLAECDCATATTTTTTRGCQTCCLARDGRCEAAATITHNLINSGNISIKDLRRFEEKSEPASKPMKSHQFCDVKNNCLDVSFAMWSEGGVCLSRGALGECMATGVCGVTPQYRVATYPDFSVNAGRLRFSKSKLNKLIFVCLIIHFTSCFMILPIIYVSVHYR